MICYIFFVRILRLRLERRYLAEHTMIKEIGFCIVLNMLRFF